VLDPGNLVCWKGDGPGCDFPISDEDFGVLLDWCDLQPPIGVVKFSIDPRYFLANRLDRLGFLSDFTRDIPLGDDPANHDASRGCRSGHRERLECRANKAPLPDKTTPNP
jgi:hypothetical protein